MLIAFQYMNREDSSSVMPPDKSPETKRTDIKTRIKIHDIPYTKANDIPYTKANDIPYTKVKNILHTKVDNISSTKVKLDHSPLRALPLKGYIVYDCDVQHPGDCGGWSDRMSGMYSAYVISVIVRKHFLIRYSKSGNLEDYLSPISFDWRYNSSILEGKSWSYQDLFSTVPKVIGRGDLAGLRNLFSRDVNFVRFNWDYTNHFRKFRNIQNVIPWMLQLHYADIYYEFFHTLFKPTKSVNDEVELLVGSASKLACAHIRMGGSATIPGDDIHTKKTQLKDIWNMLKTLENKNYSIFVATDSEDVRNQTKSLFAHLLEAKGRILHIDWKVKGGGLASGYRRVVVDFFALTKCDVMILTKSGFGMMAVYLNTNVSSIYCLTEEELVPCSRYTINDYYPGEVLSPR
ncbi:uncharacterized protein [Argopecten irradians]|uniref:uncharacterized protein n=1 Tax=Argopecten irradians TaxID=31199 RepID=UPI00371136BC